MSKKRSSAPGRENLYASLKERFLLSGMKFTELMYGIKLFSSTLIEKICPALLMTIMPSVLAFLVETKQS